MSHFNDPTQQEKCIPFTSILSLDVASLGFNPATVHAIWSPSKDFGSSGIKVVSSLLLTLDLTAEADSK